MNDFPYRNGLAQTLIFKMFARVNPIFQPRRKERTAEKWFNAVEQVVRTIYSPDETEEFEDFAKTWAATHILDSGSKIMMPIWMRMEHPWEMYGTGRRFARDAGGPMRAVLDELAKIILYGDFVTPLQWKAWSTLYPLTAQMHSSCIEMEWELIPSPSCHACSVVLNDTTPVVVGGENFCPTCGPEFTVNEEGLPVLKTHPCDVCGEEVIDLYKLGELELCMGCYDASVDEIGKDVPF